MPRTYLNRIAEPYAHLGRSENLARFSASEGGSNILRKFNPFWKSKEDGSQENALRPGWLVRAIRQWKPFGKREERPGSSLTPEDEVCATPVSWLRDIAGQ
jgi:hypothetical protein